jgi:hypothetical protein
VDGFFHEAVTEALDHQKVTASPSTVHYLTNLLSRFARTERLLDKTENGRELPTLAMYYKRAVECSTERERVATLKRLGDVSLFVAGLFADSFNRKLIDVDYYIAMGGTAYAYVAERSQSGEDGVKRVLFGELSEKFTDFVDVLDEVSESSRYRGNRDIMRLYERWLRTGSPRAAKSLARLGIVPAQGSRSTLAH